jgi:hypothetical protein
MKGSIEMDKMTLKDAPVDMDKELILPFTLATIGVTLLTLFFI